MSGVVLTDAERDWLRGIASAGWGDRLAEKVESIVADRLAAERERIAQAIEAIAGFKGRPDLAIAARTARNAIEAAHMLGRVREAFEDMNRPHPRDM